MAKPVLAILTESIRFDNQVSLKYFTKIKPVHFYEKAPYGDLKSKDLKQAVKYQSIKDLELKLLKLKPDLIQGAEPYGSKKQLKLCYRASKIARKLKIPLIFPMLENRPVKLRFGSVLGLVMKKVLKKYATQAKLIFYLNDGARKNLIEAGINPKKMVKILYGIWGVDCAVFRPLTDYRVPTTAKKKILFVGRLDEAKGIPYIMEAWQKIESKYPDIELIFAGKGELESTVKGQRIKKLGVVKNQDLPKLFNQAIFSINPSVTLKRWEEQVGMVNLQSLACGIPVVTTKSGAIPEYINSQVGILVSERNAAALAQAMEKLIKNKPLRKKLGQNGRKYILENFDAKETVKKVEKILLKII